MQPFGQVALSHCFSTPCGQASEERETGQRDKMQGKFRKSISSLVSQHRHASVGVSEPRLSILLTHFKLKPKSFLSTIGIIEKQCFGPDYLNVLSIMLATAHMWLMKC